MTDVREILRQLRLGGRRLASRPLGSGYPGAMKDRTPGIVRACGVSLLTSATRGRSGGDRSSVQRFEGLILPYFRTSTGPRCALRAGRRRRPTSCRRHASGRSAPRSAEPAGCGAGVGVHHPAVGVPARGGAARGRQRSAGRHRSPPDRRAGTTSIRARRCGAPCLTRYGERRSGSRCRSVRCWCSRTSAASRTRRSRGSWTCPSAP